jgi:hypothetical protein
MIDESVKQVAKLLHVAFNDTISQLLNLNRKANFEDLPTIAKFLSGKSKALAKKFVIEPDR